MNESQSQDDQNEQIVQDGITYLINYEEKTADIIGCILNKEEIIIPRSIKYKSTEFIVTNILQDGFNFAEVRFVKFPSDSEVRSIGKFAFNGSLIESITIPSSLIDLKDCCFGGAIYLEKIDISPDNPRYKIYDDQFIIGKSILDSKDFDVLVYCLAKIERITIPSFIKHIGSSSFFNRSSIKNIEIPENSEIETIGKYAFYGTGIERFTFPRHVTKICKKVFGSCKNLKIFEFQENSELQIIERHAFDSSSIESFTIPLHLTEIGELVFCNCANLKTIEIPINSELRTIEKEAFANTSIENFTISPSLVDLRNGWFCGLRLLKSIDVSPKNPRYKIYDNKFIIGKSSLDSENFDVLVFCFPDIQRATIPSFIKHIGSFAFVQCDRLEEINIQENSELETIGEYAFDSSLFEKFTIPPHLTKICSCAFCGCTNLKVIEISENSDLKIIEKYAFDESSIESFTIPSNLIDLNDGCFRGAEKLNRIEISPKNPRYKVYDDKFIISKSSLDSKSFDVLVFCLPQIQFASLPSFIRRITSQAFEYACIRKLEIPKNSELEIIDKFAFAYSKIEKFTVPPHLIKICESAFGYCKKLRAFDIPDTSELQTIAKSAFMGTSMLSFTISPHLTQVDQISFFDCYSIQIIEINEEAEIKNIFTITNNLNYDSLVMIPIKLKDTFCL